jgi:hypothetical protein
LLNHYKKKQPTSDVRYRWKPDSLVSDGYCVRPNQFGIVTSNAGVCTFSEGLFVYNCACTVVGPNKHAKLGLLPICSPQIFDCV